MIDINFCEFKPYRYNFIDEYGEQYILCLIALWYKGNILKMTDYHQFVGDKTKRQRVYKQNMDEVRRVCNFLNYVFFEKYYLYRAETLAEIPFEAAQAYLLEYSSKHTRFDEYPSAQSVAKERAAICMFMFNTCKFRDDKEHYYARKIQSGKSSDKDVLGKRHKKSFAWEYEIPVRYMGEYEYNLVRDVPGEAILVILKWVRLKAPDLYLEVLLQLCAGLREGEVVNVRRFDSTYPGGIIYSKENGEFTSFEMDLRKNYLLRSDGKVVGSIKNPRKQQVYTPYLKVIQEAYEHHMKLMEFKEIEDEKPLFVTERRNSNTGKHMAITESNYCKRIKNIVEKYVVPELLKSDNVELKVFAQSVNENSWGLHAFRHWFTVMLVLNNEDINSIAFWRGDESLNTAFIYLQNKGELMDRYTKVSEEISQYLIEMISGMEGVN